MGKAYHEVRLPYDPKRKVLWETLVKCYFQNSVLPTDTVVELGAGYCDFINNIKAAKKYAVDQWEGFTAFAHPDVKCMVGDLDVVSTLPDNSVDFVFASNVIEHISSEKFASILGVLSTKLRKEGVICLLQPNYRRAYKEYFDDYTHVSIWSDKSMCDFMTANKYQVITVVPGFLPLSLKSRLPVSPWLIKAYLKSPLKPLAKQMLITATPNNQKEQSE